MSQPISATVGMLPLATLPGKCLMLYFFHPLAKTVWLRGSGPLRRLSKRRGDFAWAYYRVAEAFHRNVLVVRDIDGRLHGH